MKIEIADFRGVIPKDDPRAIPFNAATMAKNVRIESGVLEAWNKNLGVTATLKAGVINTLFLYEKQHWFNWTQNVSAIESPVPQDAYSRVYFTGDGKPKFTTNTLATGGTSLPSAALDAGIQTPVDPIVATVHDSGGDPDNFSDDETIYYWYTLANDFGDEGPFGPVSNVAEKLAPSDTVSLFIPTPAVNTQGITQKRIYRGTAAGDTSYVQHVGTIPLATTSFLDDLASDELGDVLESGTYHEPDENMQGLTIGANGIAAGFAGNEVMFSEAYLPHAWPLTYRRSIAHNIVAMTATAAGFVVVTEGAPYVFAGVTPDSMTEIKLDLMQACVSARSLVDMGSSAIYASPDGLVLVSESSIDLVTRTIISKRSWKKFQPETIHAYRYENQYIGFYGDSNGNGSGVGGFVFNLQTGDFTELDFYATAGFADPLTDTLYLVVRNDGSNTLVAWDASERQGSFRWRSKIFKTQDTSFACGRVHCANPRKVGIKLYADGVCVLSLKSLQEEVFRIPSVRAKEWQIELSGSSPIQKAIIAHSMKELA